jgi:hypothetical protein
MCTSEVKKKTGKQEFKYSLLHGGDLELKHTHRNYLSVDNCSFEVRSSTDFCIAFYREKKKHARTYCFLYIDLHPISWGSNISHLHIQSGKKIKPFKSMPVLFRSKANIWYQWVNAINWVTRILTVHFWCVEIWQHVPRKMVSCVSVNLSQKVQIWKLV